MDHQYIIYSPGNILITGRLINGLQFLMEAKICFAFRKIKRSSDIGDIQGGIGQGYFAGVVLYQQRRMNDPLCPVMCTGDARVEVSPSPNIHSISLTFWEEIRLKVTGSP